MSVINWTQHFPATRVNNFRDNYIELPSFSVDSLVWKGASEVVLQFNFSASKDFTLLRRPTKPTGANFGLCIRYRVGDTVTRYKLWEDDSFILSSDAAPLYTGQRIRANFVLEIWSFEGLTEADLATAIEMTVSARSLITGLSARSAEVFATGEEFSELNNTDVAPATPIATNLDGWYRPDDYGIIVNGPTMTPGPLTNAASTGNMTDLNDTGGANVYAGVNALNGHAWLRFNGAGDYMDANYAGGIQALDRTFMGVMRIYAAGVDAGGWIAADFDGSNADKFVHLTDTTVIASKQDGSNNTSTAITLVDDEWVVFYFTVDRAGNVVKLFVEGKGENEVTTGDVLALATQLVLGNDPNSVGAFAGKFDLAELLVYSDVLSEADLVSNIQYLSGKFFDAIPLSFTFNTGGPWLSNDAL